MIKKNTALNAKNLAAAIKKANAHLKSVQNPEGYWAFDCEADVTITAEYIMFNKFIDREMEPGKLSRFTTYIMRRQMPDGGWPLHDEDGKPDISATVKAYFALKLAGHHKDEPHMVNARKLILSLGGAEKANVFTRFTLALFGQIPWDTCPAMPIEIMLLPKWFFFHLTKVSYWSRTVIVPLLIIYDQRPVKRLTLDEGVPELFVTPPDKLHNLDGWYKKPGSWRKNGFIALDRVLKRVQHLLPKGPHKKALRLAEKWMRERMQGTGGIGAIFPAMVNAVEALKILGYPEDDPDYVRGLKAVDDLVIHRPDESLCQPCHSPIWDTCLTLSATLEAGTKPNSKSSREAIDWLFDNQVFIRGDWADKNPNLAGGGWAFQYENAQYPDLDDTAMVVMALLRAGVLDKKQHWDKIAKAVNWITGMQCSNGGFAAFDIDNNALYLNDIPFADHGALMDPPTSDLTGRCIEMLSMLGFPRDYPPIARGIEFLRKEQEEDGSWFGRWGVNYLYGTWSVLAALRQVGEDMESPYIKKAVKWLKDRQNADGGWGETCYSYDDPTLNGLGKSTASQTAWALLGLMAANEQDSEEVTRGVEYLLATQNDAGTWSEVPFTGTGFPRVFYLRYHGYPKYFPAWALGVYARMAKNGVYLQDEVRLSSPAELPLPHALLTALPQLDPITISQPARKQRVAVGGGSDED